MKRTRWHDFLLLSAGQAISLLGSGMTRFAMLIWGYEERASATTLALLGFFATTSYILTSPIAGVFVDRWNRRTVMLLADLGSGVATALLLSLYWVGRLQLWHLYLSVTIAGACEAFQSLAFSATVSLLTPRESLTRANALAGLGRSLAGILSPAAAALLMQVGDAGLVMVVDLVTLGLALLSLVRVRVPAPSLSIQSRPLTGALRQELLYGFKTIVRHPGLRGLLLTFFLVNLFATLTTFAVLAPLVLARSGGDELALGVVRAFMGAGSIVGGLAVTLWGGSRRKVRAYLVSVSLSFLLGDLIIATSRGVVGWSLGGFLAEFFIPFIVSPYFALWQEAVAADVQGKVFAAREVAQVAPQPLGYLLGGALADHVFEPALRPGGALAGVLGFWVGTGPGAGMAAMFICTGVLGGLTGILGLLAPAMRDLDKG